MHVWHMLTSPFHTKLWMLTSQLMDHSETVVSPVANIARTCPPYFELWLYGVLWKFQSHSSYPGEDRHSWHKKNLHHPSMEWWALVADPNKIYDVPIFHEYIWIHMNTSYMTPLDPTKTSQPPNKLLLACGMFEHPQARTICEHDPSISIYIHP